MRTTVVAFMINPLPFEFSHPRTALLTFARVEISIENSKKTAVFVENLIRFYVRVIDRNIVVGFECDAIETGGKAKNTFDYI